MPKYAVLLRYEVVSGLVVEAKDEDEAVQLATRFEADAHDETAESETDELFSSVRGWGGGDITVEEVADDDEGEDLLEEWTEDLELDDEYDEDDLDIDDDDEYDDDLEPDEDEDEDDD